MPADRALLSDRAKVHLRVDTSLVESIEHDPSESQKARLRRHARRHPYKKPPKSAKADPAGASNEIAIAVQPAHAYNTRNRRGRTVLTVKPKPRLPPLPPLKSFHSLAEEISFAFSDGEYDPTTIYPPQHSYPPSSSVRFPQPFTHIIRIVHPTARLSHLGTRYPKFTTESSNPPQLIPGEAWVHYDDASRRSILTLVTSSRPLKRGNMPSLTKTQLIVARDFMMLALPLLLSSPEDGEGPNSRSKSPAPVSDPAHVLITGPAELSTSEELLASSELTKQTARNIICIASVFCAYGAGNSIHDVLQSIHDHIYHKISRVQVHQLTKAYQGENDNSSSDKYVETLSDIEPWKPHFGLVSPEVQDLLRFAVHADDPYSVFVN
ncbi:hypothetical protein CVT26_013678 [Gymnopilus dilepis]|uniref:Uncharacterized protein n=1 Tax=Gymnopilus dilepis TaxID=231916 RepID=A0A409YWB4_9AGAR|nr:hypothetical protein CVT26_013678 [Gymnopilus dilepis]